jgi:hypothetical protein
VQKYSILTLLAMQKFVKLTIAPGQLQHKFNYFAILQFF